MKKEDLGQRFGFLVNEVGRLYGKQFDQLSRQNLGLTRAQCRLINILAKHEGSVPLRQTELAERLDLTTMGVTSLCNRLEAGGWIRRHCSPSDGRANEIHLMPKSIQDLGAARVLSEKVQAKALAGLTTAQRANLLQLLRQVHANLTAE